MADRSGTIARARRSPLGRALAALALAAGLTSVAGMPVASAQGAPRPRATQLSQGVARPSAEATQAPAAASPRASASAVSPVAPSTSLGFDACATPSQRTMTAWAASPYRSIGVYVGGANRACSQPNLTSTWVAAQVAAGWHLIPTYVGLQSPTSGCTSCAKLSSGKATAQGEEAAEDAVADAQGIGMGAGTPIYFDMEGYARTSSSTRATLTFLEAWTAKLHAFGYVSGVYSSAASGIADLAAQIGTGYPLPDDLWIADWNGRADAEEAFLPSYDWAHRRIHQYRGGHDETYGGVTINIDNDYVDGATFGSSPAPPPLTVSRVRPSGATVSVTVTCGWSPETSCPGQILLRTHIRLPLGRARPGSAGARREVRIAVAHRTFRLAGGRSHTFRVALNARGRPLLRERRRMRAQLLVAIPDARVTRPLSLTSLW